MGADSEVAHALHLGADGVDRGSGRLVGGGEGLLGLVEARLEALERHHDGALLLVPCRVEDAERLRARPAPLALHLVDLALQLVAQPTELDLGLGEELTSGLDRSFAETHAVVAHEVLSSCPPVRSSPRCSMSLAVAFSALAAPAFPDLCR